MRKIRSDAWHEQLNLAIRQAIEESGGKISPDDGVCGTAFRIANNLTLPDLLQFAAEAIVSRLEEMDEAERRAK